MMQSCPPLIVAVVDPKKEGHQPLYSYAPHLDQPHSMFDMNLMLTARELVTHFSRASRDASEHRRCYHRVVRHDSDCLQFSWRLDAKGLATLTCRKELRRRIDDGWKISVVHGEALQPSFAK